MNRKRLIVAWVKNIVAFVIDLFIAVLFTFAIEIVLVILLMPFIAKGYLVKIERVLDVPILLLYFYLYPRLFGNTLGRKILRIQDKFNIFWSPLNRLDRKYNKFPAKHLKKEEILKVSVRDGHWICPSCSELSIAIYDVCSNCGQEVEKQNE